MAYAIRHVTTFRYKPAVGESIMEVRMQPRSDLRQRCLTFALEVHPRANVMSYRDFFGNAVHHFDIPGRHQTIEISAQAIVEVTPPLDLKQRKSSAWDELETRVQEGDYWEMLLPSQFAKPTELLEKLAAELNLKRSGEPLALLRELNEALYDKFDYVPNSTNVDSPIDDALRTRQGVCQDFAHIMIALVRQLKIPCRYVSGYLYHGSEDKDRSPAGATHAWVEAYLGEAGWVAFDPTNNLLGSERHVCVAVGRDYSDVPPTRGVYKGEADSELSVRVIVQPVDAPQPEELPPAMVLRSKRSDSAASAPMEQQQQQ
ncbi:MAG TPA: transglutaminase family protein [Candidatus Sulfotelmatobacter sp.]|jgi:transglutaminase-like putative cysteine protease|nr:transglutaminase family protein [Candidatus Sulfotelmatobacter sp.]